MIQFLLLGVHEDARRVNHYTCIPSTFFTYMDTVLNLSAYSSHCRCAHLHELSEERAQKLEDSKKLQQFLRDVDEVGSLGESSRGGGEGWGRRG